MKKTFTKHILLLALMLFGVAGAAWASRAPQKFTGPVDIYDLMDGDTLASGFSLTYGHGQQEIISFVAGRYSIDGTPQAYPGGADLTGDHELQSLIFTASNILMYFGEERTDTIAPMVDMSTPGNAWVVSDFNKGTEGVTMKISGIYIAPDPTVPALDELTGNWNFLMPGSNKVVKAVLYDSIVLGPHVELYDAQPAFAAGDIYHRGDSTIYYYDTNNHHSFHLRADEQAGGKYFGYWSDLDPTDPQYNDRANRYVSPGYLTCGQRFTAAYANNHTLTLVTPQGGGTLEIAGVTYDTVYNINFYHIGSLEGTRSFTIPASRLPYDTTFNYNANVSMVQLDEQPGKLRKIQVEQSVTIRIEGAFEGTAHYTCMLDGDGDPDEWVITCTAVEGLPIMPYGISKTGDNTYSVMEGLTVNVTATPDAAHYLSAIGNEAVISNSAYNISFTMPDDDAELAATFTTKPTLTLAQTAGGTLEAIVPQGGVTAMHLTTDQIPTWDGVFEPALETDLQQFGFVAVDSAAAAAWTGVPASGDIILVYALEGNQFKAILFQDGQWHGTYTSNFYKTEIYAYTNADVFYFTTGASKSNVIASSTPNTYYIDYGTPVTVVATPDSVHYLVSFSDDDPATERNSNIAVEKRYDSVINDIINLSATFQAKPTLTLTANDGGTLTLDGYSPDATTYNITIEGGNTYTNVTFPFQTTVFLHEGLYDVSAGGQDPLSVDKDGNNAVITISEPYGGGRTISYTYIDDNENFIVSHKNISCQSVESAPIMPAGVVSANATRDTFVVDYGTDVTVVATPEVHHHLEGWSCTPGTVIPGPDSTASLTMTQNETVSATFAQNAPELAWEYDDETLANGDTLSAYHGFETDTIAKILFSANKEFLKDWRDSMMVSKFILRFGSSNTNVVSFANPFDPQSLSVNAPGTATVYMVHDGSVMAYDSAYFTAVILAPDTLTLVHNDGGAMIVETLTDSIRAIVTDTTYAVVPGANVTVVAMPDATHYLVNWDNDAAIYSNTDTTKHYVVNGNMTSTATFNDKPVLTLAASDTSWGKVTLGGYSPVGVAKLTDSTYRVDYGTEVTVQADATELHHVANWVNEDSVAYPAANITYSAYFVTEPVALFPDSSTLTITVTADATAKALFGINSYDVVATAQLDDRAEIGTDTSMGYIAVSYIDIVGDAQTVDPTDTAEITAQGGSASVFTVTPHYGYLFTGWYDADEDTLMSALTTLTLTEAYEVEARFVPDTFTVSLTMNDEHAGDVLPHGQLPAGVTVGPNVTYRVPYLVPMTFYGAAMEHNHIVNWINENDAEYVDGVTYSDYLVCDTFPTTSLLTLAVTGDTTVKINFLVDYYYVTVGLDEESTGRGTVTGSGYYDHGDTVTAMASPAEGYHFDGWDNGVEISPYAFAAVQDSTILVHFDTNVYSLTVVAETDTNTGLPMGTTLGDGLVKHFLYYDIEAVAEEGYHFVMWTDSVTDNPRTVTLTENTTFTAHFEMDPIVDVVINGVSADETMGTVSGSDTVDYGEEVILTATANEHYHFVQWNDGNSDNPRTVVAAHDSTLTAYFAVNQYAVVGVSADETMGTVSGSDTADYQSVVVLTATAGDCYHFESWSDGETANPRSIVAEADTTVSALFAANVYSMNDTVTVCDSYEWNGTVYTQSGTYTHDGTTAAGCDMLETLYLTVNASTTAVETVTACDSYEWHDSVYTASTDESTYQTTNAAGCDSTVTLHLTVNAATASEESETACNYYTWHGETYTVSGDYSYTTQNAAGCDSTVTLHLTVNYGNLISIDSTVCDSIVWHGNVYTESGVYDFDLPSESGCFSIETLNLTVNYSSSAVETIFACDSYTWNGLQFDADNHTATYFTVNAVGCDSTVMLDLTVHYSNEGTDNVTACDSVEWHGTVYTASDNTATYSTINAAGCDSTVVLVLTINHSVSDTVEVTAEESYEWNGEVYSQSGTYTYSGTTEAGCDSTVTLLLTITYQPQPVYYTVTLVSADTTMGSVLPAEAMSVEEGSQFSATAIALYGRHFVAWERDGQVVSTDNPYSFEVTEDVELTATFAYNPVTVILSVNNANWGSTDPAPGTYTYEVGEQATVTATPAEGFHMMGWTINGTVIETDETTYTVEATSEMAGMTFSVVAMFVRDIAIDDVEDGNIAVYASDGKIVVSGAEHRDVYVYDVTGRCVSRQADAAETVVFPVAQTGVYMVKIGNLPARKVALVR